MRSYFAVSLCAAMLVGVNMPTDNTIYLKVVGGLASVSQYNDFEQPFWQQRIETLSNGRIKAEIQPFDRSGLPGPEMLQLMRLGVVPIGTALLALVSADEPELNAVDLPGLNPDMPALRQTVALYRPRIERILHDQFGIKLLAIYAYPAQVIFCTKPLTRLRDLAGRRIRTSSVGQSEMMAALGATPILIPFADVVQSVRTGVVDCAITGTLSGNEIGLSEVTSYLYPMAISWGLSFFGANITTWNALPADVRNLLLSSIHDLEAQIWHASEQETSQGIACDTGVAACDGHPMGHMQLVPLSDEDAAERKRLLLTAVLPGWIQRCGSTCAAAWNQELAPTLGIRAPQP
jgi:TRAP-type C4-dicarboxylate transport system substrate-binding protein